MAKPDTIIVDGHAISWRRISELRRQQLEVWQAEQARQLALFELRTIAALRRSARQPDVSASRPCSPCWLTPISKRRMKRETMRQQDICLVKT
jgi:hypothetical protein